MNKVATILTASFLADIKPALDDARYDSDHHLYEVGAALRAAKPVQIVTAKDGRTIVSITVMVSRKSVEALIDEARWRFRAWEGSPDRCIAEHYRRFCQSIGVQPQSL